MFRSLRLLLAMTAALGATGVQAASVSLVPSAGEIGPGASLGLDLVLDASDGPGDLSPGSFSGIVVVDFDPALADFTGFSFTSPAAPLGSPTEDSGSVELGFENAATTGVIGTFSFDVLAAPGDVLAFGLADADDFFGTFVNTDPSNQTFFPEFAGAEVSVVPLPSAAWLMLSALGLGFATLRRRVRERTAM